MGHLQHICLPAVIGLCLVASNYVAGYGTSTRTTPPPNPPPSPPKYQNEREGQGQWGGPSGSYPTPDRRQPGADYYDEKENFFAKRSHVERYGVPEGCVKQPDPAHACNYFVEIAKEEDHPDSLHFEISAHVPSTGGYVAVGLSKDQIMGEDHIVECVLPANGATRLYHSWALAKRQPTRLQDDFEVITTDDKFPQYEDGILSCKFRRPIITHVDVNGVKNKFDLENGLFHILLAVGGLQFPNSDQIGYHGDKPLESGHAYVSPGLLGHKQEKYPPRTDAFGDKKAYYGSGARNPAQCFSVQAGFFMIIISFLFV